MVEEDPLYFEKVKGGNIAEIMRKKTLLKVIRDTEQEKGTVTFLYSNIGSLRELSV